jgi:uncharacterized protein (DUF2141 family)
VFLLLWVLNLWGAVHAAHPPLVLRVAVEEPARGQWMVSLRDAQGKPLQERVFPVKGAAKSAELNWGALEPGTYTLAVYLDQNRNNKLDKGMVGQPLEPYAFSNNARAPFSSPSLEEQRFAHPGKLPVLLLR